MNKIVAALLRFISGEDRFVTVEQVYKAVSAGGFTVLKIQTRQPDICIVGNKARILYRETHRADGKHVETIDMIVPGHLGGMIVTFVDDLIVEVTHNAVERNHQRMTEEEHQRVWQILLQVRHAVCA